MHSFKYQLSLSHCLRLSLPTFWPKTVLHFYAPRSNSLASKVEVSACLSVRLSVAEILLSGSLKCLAYWKLFIWPGRTFSGKLAALCRQNRLTNSANWAHRTNSTELAAVALISQRMRLHQICRGTGKNLGP